MFQRVNNGGHIFRSAKHRKETSHTEISQRVYEFHFDSFEGIFTADMGQGGKHARRH